MPTEPIPFDYPDDCFWCGGHMSRVDPLDSGPAVCTECGAKAEFNYELSTHRQASFDWTTPRKAFEILSARLAERWDSFDGPKDDVLHNLLSDLESAPVRIGGAA